MNQDGGKIEEKVWEGKIEIREVDLRCPLDVQVETSRRSLD